MFTRSVVALYVAVAFIGGASCTEDNPYLNVCSNNVLEPEIGEECDDGFDGNDDHAACTLSCQRAFCGDGLIQTGVELCDDGERNDELGPCTPWCEPPRCGDGVIQPLEECDDGDDNKIEADGLGGCSTACTALPRCGDGLPQAPWEECDDAIGKCHLAAKAFGHPRPDAFFAWISDGEESASEWLYHSQGRYLLSTGEVVADNWDDLTDGSLADAIDRGIDGLLIEGPVWTATAPDGSAYPEGHCGGWNESSLDPAIYGYSDLKDEGWTHYTDGAGTCSDAAHLYCIEAW